MKNYNHALLVMEKQEYPAEAKEVIIRAEEKILNNEKANALYETMYRAYWLKKKNFDAFKDKVKALAEMIGEHEHTVKLVLLINCTKPLLALYKKKGISEEIYWNTIIDLKVKMLECIENYGVPGVFVEGWFKQFYTLERFGIGRFQYELADFCEDFYYEHGIELHDSQFVLGMHIPSHLGSLDYEVRMDSYKKAYEFFKDRFDGPMVVCCGSWLLYPDNLNILPEIEKLAETLEGDEKTGVKIVLKALEAPVRQISDNAGFEGSVIINEIRKANKAGYGFDAYTEKYVDMIEAGIVDPTKVTRSALQNAASISSTILTTEALVADKKNP